jgi:hypothetical protein
MTAKIERQFILKIKGIEILKAAGLLKFDPHGSWTEDISIKYTH